MIKARILRTVTMLCSGAMMLQFGGCGPVPSLVEILQTVFLGVTAAGSIVIIDNL